MFGLFKNKRQKLEQKYQDLMRQAFELSHTDRRLSDEKMAQANAIGKQIEALDRDPQ